MSPGTGRALWRVIVSRPRKLARKDIGSTIRAALRPESIIAIWWSGLPNWGDVVNPVLIAHLAGEPPLQHDRLFNVCARPVYSVIGSVLGRAPIVNLEVWGSGFKHAGSRFWIKPRRIHAVRGPLTREIALRQGVDCPQIFGDPALLFPRIYRPPRTRRHTLGIVPHYVDADAPALRALRDRGDVLVIDILGGVTEVADQVCSCEVIASSSLHGMILADAYGIPSTWIRFSNRVEGSGFKFRDYLASVNRKLREPLNITVATTAQQILDYVRYDPVDIDLERLLASCPFMRVTDSLNVAG